MNEMLTDLNSSNEVVDDVRTQQLVEAKRIYENMAENEKKEIIEFISKIDISDSQMVRRYGIRPEGDNAAFCDNFLAYAKKGSYEEREVKDTILKLVNEVEKAAPTDEGFLGKLIYSANQQKKRIVRKMQSVSEVILEIENELKALQLDINNNILDIEKFGQSLLSNMVMLEKYIVAGELALEKFLTEEGAKCEERMKVASQNEKIIIKREFDDKHKEFLMRLNDLRTAQSVAMVSIMQLFEMKKENMLVYDSIHKSIQFTIPIWKQQCSIALMQKTTEKSAKANKSLTKATEKMLQDNVAAINAGYIEAVKTSQEGFINPEVIIKVTDDIKKTLAEVQKLEDQAFKKQTERSKMLAQGRDALLTLATSIDRESQLVEFMRLKTNSSGSDDISKVEINPPTSGSISSNTVNVSTKLEI